MMPTKEKLLREAALFMKGRGYSAFSYADLAEKVGIRKASIHHHFSTKERLGELVVQRAIEDTQKYFEDVEESSNYIVERLRAYMLLFSEGYQEKRLPLCCVLSVDMANLPDSIKKKAKIYFEIQINWLTRIVQQGREVGDIVSSCDPACAALTIFTMCEGASVVARAIENADIFDSTFNEIVKIFVQKA
ncbi:MULTISPECIES: TetR/AcrR family transcriptional regulator [unclassified Saccharibacter]|uniref:TetR/AcrR family transcriptional regulator n=1 Tax=unclassified Saccharibacter TaxID=2648722 RepID=UPI001328FD8E|nr:MULTISPECIES: TetR/AcrR family transcriptional regulator [unclassified Saccharibacter]MXV36740.1 TetR family transcriptional regulator [Saccharibacter sp. EH611]MXV58232.1 TetR family transcriptional regulator [Saccharibacter sp. EH70]MXV65688.1 TetR family transcriptional regulator [Saccharibacter sp. EH60]